MFEIMPVLDSNKNTPLYVQLYEYIKQEIQKGTIKPETKLPSKRKLANYLEISQNTIQTAYEQLCAEGYVESKPRKVLFVTNIDDDLLHYPIHETKLKSDKDKKKEPKCMIDFSSGKVDLDYFPYSIWRRLTIQSLSSDQSSILSLGEPQGEKNLREEISKYLFQSRGVQCSAEQVIIGAGTQFLLILLCMLIGKKYSYAIENPGFHRARYIFKDQGIDVQPISVKVKNGMSEEDLMKTALDMKIKVYPTSIYYDKYENSEYPSIILGFGGLKELQIEEGINILKNAWQI